MLIPGLGVNNCCFNLFSSKDERNDAWWFFSHCCYKRTGVDDLIKKWFIKSRISSQTSEVVVVKCCGKAGVETCCCCGRRLLNCSNSSWFSRLSGSRLWDRADSCSSSVLRAVLARVWVTNCVFTLVSVLYSVAVISFTEVSRMVVMMGLPRKVTASSVESVSVIWVM